jgi:hypothetical protein
LIVDISVPHPEPSQAKPSEVEREKWATGRRYFILFLLFPMLMLQDKKKGFSTPQGIEFFSFSVAKE